LKKLRIFGKILRSTGTDKVIYGFLGFTALCALIIWLIEPEIRTFREALWYCFTAISTIGFGDVVVHSAVSRVLTVLLSVYAVAVIAIFTAVVVNYFQRVASGNLRESLDPFLSQVEKLPDLSREEMEELSRKAGEFRKK
jgi:voltage-gated potassium channel